jgi:hypothetical protein
MIRIASLLAAAAALIGTPAIASVYSAKPAVQPQTARIIARDIAWKCGPAACLGQTEESRPAVLCEGLAKRAGRLDNFVAAVARSVPASSPNAMPRPRRRWSDRPRRQTPIDLPGRAARAALNWAGLASLAAPALFRTCEVPPHPPTWAHAAAI